MGESTCLMHNSFSLASDTAHDEFEANPVPALTESISFGKFVSETLDWGKWSSFSRNRYLEDVEKYSTPGSVAQKKAYFEAHYKRIAAQKAASLLEQANAAATDFSEPEKNVGAGNGISPDSGICGDANSLFHIVDMKDKLVESNSNVAVGKPDESVSPATDVSFFANGSESVEKMDGMEADNGEEVDPLIQGVILSVSPLQIESSQQLGNAENQNRVTETEHGRISQMEKQPLKLKENSAAAKKKATVSATKPVVPSRSNKLPPYPAKPATPTPPRKENNASPNSKKSARVSLEKKRSTPKSLHMSINFAPYHAGESTPSKTNKRASPTLEKSGGSKIATSSSKKSQDSLNTLKTPIAASTNRVLKLSSVTPQSENRRTKPPLELTAPGSRKVDRKWQSLSVDPVKSSSVCGTEARSPIVSSFSFRSEERTAKRKEYFLKLEEKFNAKDTQKVQFQAKSKERAEIELKKLRQSLNFKAKPMPDFYREMETPKNLKKIPLTRPRSPKLGKKANPNMSHDASSLPPLRPPVKNDASKHFTEKKNRMPNRSLSSFQNKNTHENTSPNIQR